MVCGFHSPKFECFIYKKKGKKKASVYSICFDSILIILSSDKFLYLFYFIFDSP